MLTHLITFAMRQRAAVLFATFILIGIGSWSAIHLPIDAVPDITNPQVQINTAVNALAPEEIEKLVSFPIESEMAGLPQMVELRSLSKFGLSQVTMVFHDDVDLYRTRQLVTERLQAVLDELPHRGLDQPGAGGPSDLGLIGVAGRFLATGHGRAPR